MLASDAPTPIFESAPMTIRLKGFPARAEVLLTATRRLTRWTGGAKGPWTPEGISLVAWANVRCNADGSIDLDRTKIQSGSFSRTGAAGLFWSGYPAAEAQRRIGPRPTLTLPADLPPSDVLIEASLAGRRVLAGVARFADPPGIEIVPIVTPTLNGCYAYPIGAPRRGGLISLHGSEGGSVASARSRAITFAANGIPTLAVNYFAWPNERVPNLAQSNLNSPVELLTVARDWLVRRPEVDPARIGLWGVSKGAEFALVGAATYPWVKAAVAVVPSDSVWEGYPTPSRQGQESTWSLAGRPLPYIPLFDPDEGRFRVNTDRYEQSRRAHPQQALAARIPLERTRAQVLLLGSDRDEVWASGAMTRNLVARMRRYGRGGQIEARTYPRAGHQISGAGLFPVRLYGIDSRDPRDKSLDDEAAATLDARVRTLRFLRRRL